MDAREPIAVTHATIVGLGNIGSALVPLVARMADIERVTLVDPDDYAESNLASQSIDRAALSKRKVDVQAACIRAINPRLTVSSYAESIENVPLASLRDSILLSCVDQRQARQTINRIAWRSGTPWIDAAVGADSLVRLSTFTPATGAPCLECSWDSTTYELLEQRYACKGQASVPATDAPAELGGLAASLQAAELRKFVTGAGDTLSGAQLMFDTASYSKHLNRFKRSDACRFDHAVWAARDITVDLDEIRLGGLLDLVDAGRDVAISLEGHTFVTGLDCIACGAHAAIELSLLLRLPSARRSCKCGGSMFPPGFFAAESIRGADLAATEADRSLASIGFRSGDVLTVSDAAAGVRHVELKGCAAR